MLFFKRYLEKSQITLENFENSKIPCYLKMRELPAPKKLDRMDDLVYQTSVIYKQYIKNWLEEEYFNDHNNDYIGKMDFFHELENIIAAQHVAIQYANATSNIPFIRVEKIPKTKLAPPPPRSIVVKSPQLSVAKEVAVSDKQEDGEGEEAEYKNVSPGRRCTSRNLFDLVLESECQFERYCGIDWIEDEYFLILDNTYLVSSTTFDID